jgi:hypothetical protein
MSKGDKWRKTDFKNFFNNFNDIKFKKKKPSNNSEVTPPTVSNKKGKTTYKYS